MILSSGVIMQQPINIINISNISVHFIYYKEKRKYVAITENQIIGYCKILDIYDMFIIKSIQCI